MSAPVIAIRDLVVAAGTRTLLQVPQLQVAPGERVALVGANGAGKSTLLRVLAGSVVPAAGQVQVLGRAIGPAQRGAMTRAQWRALRAQVGQVQQGLHPVPRLSARDNVLIGALARADALPAWRSWLRLFPPALRAEADAALAALGLLALADTRADRLSGGERQKLLLARLQLQRAPLVLADEPTAALDPAATQGACRALLQAAAGGTLVSVLHQQALLPLLADRVLGLAHGRIVWDLPVGAVDAALLDDLYALPATPVADARAAGPASRRTAARTPAAQAATTR